MKSKLDIDFSIGSQVIVDGDDSLIMYVIGIAWFGKRIEYQCAWMHEGQSYDNWFVDWRLKEIK